MTLNEATQFCHEKSENIKLKAEPQIFIDIAEWLEELKVYKECNISKTNFSMGYNKAIDDFVEKLEEMKTDRNCNLSCMRFACGMCDNFDKAIEIVKECGTDGTNKSK